MLKNQNNIKTYLISNLNTTIIGKRIYHRATLNSTMEYAKLLARKGAKEGTIVIADEQTSGKGRLDRIWLSPKDNIAMSVILHPSLTILPQIIMIASVAVVRAIRKVCNLDSKIKWPNDIQLNGKKVCGILIENEVRASEVNFTVIGIGMNINLDISAYLEIATLATSLSNELGYKVKREKICFSVLTEMEKLYLSVISGNSVYQEWKANMNMLGKTIHVQSGTIKDQGVAEDVTEQGNLILRKDDGTTAELLAGDVSIV